MNRYFYITYKYAGVGYHGNGSYTLESKEYPSKASIEAHGKEYIEKKELVFVNSVIVGNILEMSEDDFRSFTKKPDND